MVTQPRMPCYKLDLRFEREDMIKRFLISGRSGFYFSVIEPGEVSVGSMVEILSRDLNRVTVADIGRLRISSSDSAIPSVPPVLSGTAFVGGVEVILNPRRATPGGPPPAVSERKHTPVVKQKYEKDQRAN